MVPNFMHSSRTSSAMAYSHCGSVSVAGSYMCCRRTHGEGLRDKDTALGERPGTFCSMEVSRTSLSMSSERVLAFMRTPESPSSRVEVPEGCWEPPNELL